jgi:electron transfer flavoprotein alpha subunit
MSTVWVYAEVGHDGGVAPSALELLTKARSLTPNPLAIALGPGAKAAAAILGEYGATTVYASDDAVYADHPGEPTAYAIRHLAEEHVPDLIVFGPSYESRDVAGRLQGMLGSGLVANVDDIVAADEVRLTVALSVWPGRPGNLRGGIAGAKVVEVSLAGPAPRLVLTRAAAFETVPCGNVANVVELQLEIPRSAGGCAARAAEDATGRSSSARGWSWPAGAASRSRRTSPCSTSWRARSETPPSAQRDLLSTPVGPHSGCRSDRRARP